MQEALLIKVLQKNFISGPHCALIVPNVQQHIARFVRSSTGCVHDTH